MNKGMLNFTPDATVLISILVSYLLNSSLPIIVIVAYPFNMFGWILVLAGIGLALYTIGIIRASNPTSYVTENPRSIISTGPYLFSRNPFYLAYVMLTTGIAIALGSLSAFAGPLLCFAVLQIIIIPFEEKNLRKTFGHKYNSYSQKVRRWL